MPQLSHCAQEVYTHDRDLFLKSLFVPEPARESLLAVYALIVELEKINRTVSEEMIGHIRLAWWQESIEALYAGGKPQGHPVLETLSPAQAQTLIPLVEAYRNAYPEIPGNRQELIELLSLPLLKVEDQRGWRQANRTIVEHRKHYGKRLHVWLVLKLLLFSLI